MLACFGFLTVNLAPVFAAEKNPEPENELFQRGCNFMVDKQFENAVSAFTEAVARNSHDANCYFRRGQCFFCLQSFDQAVLDFNRAISCDSSNPQFFLWRGTAHARLNHDDDAIRDYEKAMRLDPGLIEAYREGEETKKVSPSWDTVKTDPAKKTGSINLGSSPNALKDYAEAVSRASSNLSGYFRPGTVYSGVCGLDGKLVAIPGMVEDNSQIVIEKRQGTDFVKLKDADRMVRDLDQKINDQPNLASLYFGRARAYQQLRRKTDALSDFNRAIDLDRNNANYLLARAFFYNQQGQNDLAKADLGRAQDLDPTVPVLVKFEPRPKAESASKDRDS